MPATRNLIKEVRRVPFGDLKPHPENWTTHPATQRTAYQHLTERLGFASVVYAYDDPEWGLTILDGHLRQDEEDPGFEVDVAIIDVDRDQARMLLASYNPLAYLATPDTDALAELYAQLDDPDNILRTMLAGLLPKEQGGVPPRPFAERFLASPFSVLDGRAQWWRERKQRWLALGIQSELGREQAVAYLGKPLAHQQQYQGDTQAEGMTGTSVFDPVLCELAYRWFSPRGGVVVDPFAGGSVRGIVASLLGRKYHGIDLNAAQVAANDEQAGIADPKNPPRWYVGDGRSAGQLLPARLKADLLFSCPPYGSLEVYSDDPADLSNMNEADYLAAHADVIHAAVARLKDNRFAVWVVGEYRSARGYYTNLVGYTILAFKAAGLEYYNEAVLLTPVGSLPIRAGGPFEQSRKLGKAHQNVLVFVKGDPAKAAKAIGAVEYNKEEPIG